MLKVCTGTPKSPEKLARCLLLDYQQLNLQDGSCWITNSFGQCPGSPTEEKCFGLGKCPQRDSIPLLSMACDNNRLGHCRVYSPLYVHTTLQHKSPSQVRSNRRQAAKQRSGTKDKQISFGLFQPTTPTSTIIATHLAAHCENNTQCMYNSDAATDACTSGCADYTASASSRPSDTDGLSL